MLLLEAGVLFTPGSNDGKVIGVLKSVADTKPLTVTLAVVLWFWLVAA
jgi:hypothetical protein